MRKSRTSDHAVANQVAAEKRQIKGLRARRRKLVSELATVDSKIATLKPVRRLSTAELDRLLDKLSDGLDGLPPLPADFSRADLYDDHD